MTRPDDSSLSLEDLRAVEKRAKHLLDRAEAWGRLPVPIEDIIAAANLKLAPSSAFDPVSIMSYLHGKAADAVVKFKGALSKVLGIYDPDEALIHVDDTLQTVKQTFLKLHETGHHELPVHRKMFRFFADCAKTLDPATADQFEREANNFARFALFQGDAFGTMAADFKFEIKTPIKLAKKFGASNYAGCREYARSSNRACVVYILEPIELVEGLGACAKVRRIEASVSFKRRFGQPTDQIITSDHKLGPLLPIGRRMTSPRQVVIKDLNGDRHECLAEAFDTKWNVIILLWPTKELSASPLIMPAGFKPAA